MGSKGIKRRRPYRRLPPARVPTENELIPPNIMWPAPGSGFEADPFSPAGTAQRRWWILQGLVRPGGGRFRTTARVAVLAVLVAPAVVFALVQLAHLVSGG